MLLQRFQSWWNGLVQPLLLSKHVQLHVIYTFSCTGPVLHNDHKLLQSLHVSSIYYKWILTEFPENLGEGAPRFAKQTSSFFHRTLKRHCTRRLYGRRACICYFLQDDNTSHVQELISCSFSGQKQHTTADLAPEAHVAYRAFLHRHLLWRAYRNWHLSIMLFLNLSLAVLKECVISLSVNVVSNILCI